MTSERDAHAPPLCGIDISYKVSCPYPAAVAVSTAKRALVEMCDVHGAVFKNIGYDVRPLEAADV